MWVLVDDALTKSEREALKAIYRLTRDGSEAHNGRNPLNPAPPAYAVTIHKSQGSEFPAVIVPVMDVPPKLCYRNLLYTGVTRAKTLCILAGHSAEVAQMVRSVRRNKRFSCLGDMIRDETL